MQLQRWKRIGSHCSVLAIEIAATARRNLERAYTTMSRVLTERMKLPYAWPCLYVNFLTAIAISNATRLHHVSIANPRRQGQV